MIYPDTQLAAVYGLTYLFRIAGDMSAARHESNAPAIRVTHWQQAQNAGVGCTG